MQCVEQRIIKVPGGFEVIGFGVEGDLVAREPKDTVESAARHAVANIPNSGRVTFHACAAEALGNFVAGVMDVPQWNAAYTSEWDCGITLTTKCVWDPVNRVVLDQERVELDGVDACVKEFVTYRDEEFVITDEGAEDD